MAMFLSDLSSRAKDWYRRTDGEYGNVERGAIQIVEQPNGVEPNILEVFNPLVRFMVWEENEQTIDRMFNLGRIAVLPQIGSVCSA